MTPSMNIDTWSMSLLSGENLVTALFCVHLVHEILFIRIVYFVDKSFTFDSSDMSQITPLRCCH